jgi:hypothetical protein
MRKTESSLQKGEKEQVELQRVFWGRRKQGEVSMEMLCRMWSWKVLTFQQVWGKVKQRPREHQRIPQGGQVEEVGESCSTCREPLSHCLILHPWPRVRTLLKKIDHGLEKEKEEWLELWWGWMAKQIAEEKSPFRYVSRWPQASLEPSEPWRWKDENWGRGGVWKRISEFSGRSPDSLLVLDSSPPYWQTRWPDLPQHSLAPVFL